MFIRALVCALVIACASSAAYARGGGHSYSSGSRSGGGHSHSSGGSRSGGGHSHSSGGSRSGGGHSHGSYRSSVGYHSAVVRGLRRTVGRSSHRVGVVSELHSRRAGYASRGSHSYNVGVSSGARDSRGRLMRSVAAKDAFKRNSPCPSTGRSRGACPGYVIDHIRALKRGGPDTPSNMQWQTIQAAKAKDKIE